MYPANMNKEIVTPSGLERAVYGKETNLRLHGAETVIYQRVDPEVIALREAIGKISVLPIINQDRAVPERNEKEVPVAGEIGESKTWLSIWASRQNKRLL